MRQQAIGYRDPLLYSMEPELSLAPLPATIQDKVCVSDIACHYVYNIFQISNNQVVIQVNTIGGKKTTVQIEGMLPLIVYM